MKRSYYARRIKIALCGGLGALVAGLIISGIGNVGNPSEITFGELVLLCALIGICVIYVLFAILLGEYVKDRIWKKTYKTVELYLAIVASLAGILVGITLILTIFPVCLK